MESVFEYSQSLESCVQFHVNILKNLQSSPILYVSTKEKEKILKTAPLPPIYSTGGYVFFRMMAGAGTRRKVPGVLKNVS